MYPTKKLSEICVIGPKKSEVSKLDSNTLVSFVPMRDVKEGEKYFLPSESKKLSEVYSGYTYFNNEDVILAKVTPCFENGKSGIARDLENGIGFGSSEFYVFRCNPGVLPEYLYRVISSQKFLKEGADNMSGAVGLQRVTKEFIENYNFPLPPLSTQSKIVMKLDEAFGNIDRQISLLKTNIEDVERVRKSAMEESFQSGEYEMKRLGEVLSLNYGKAVDKANKSENGMYDVYGANGVMYKSDQYLFDGSSIIVGRKGSAGALNRVRGKFWASDVTYYVTSNECIDYLFYILQTLHLPGLAKGVKPGINRNEVYEIQIPLPPLLRQHEIVEHLDRVFAHTAELRSSYEAQIRDLETLRQSLLEEAFAGRLVSK